MRWSWVALGVVVAVLAAGATNPVAARPVQMPGAVEVLALEPNSADIAVLRWGRREGMTYRLCFNTEYSFTGLGACYDLGPSDDWPVRVPEYDGGIFYLTLQECRLPDCAEPVRAGAVGRRTGAGAGFYATALPAADGRVRMSAFAGSGPATISFYRAAAGAAEMRTLTCPDIPAGEACYGAELSPAGALVGAGAALPGGREQGITFQLRDRPVIYLMFDDGTGIVSGGKYLMQSVLDEFGVKGTFFLTGPAMRTYPSAVRALVAGGHRVGSHTWSHPFLTRLSDAAVGQELDLTEQQYRATIPGGTLRPCFRAPNGDINARVLAVLHARGYQQYTQSISSEDYAGVPAARMIRTVLAEAKDGASISFHTQESQTATALRTIIPALLAQGYQFGIVC